MRQQKQSETQVTMSQMSQALSAYLDIYGTFGEENNYSDFVANPVEFLITEGNKVVSKAFLALE